MKAAAGVLEKQLQDLSADDPGRAALLRDYQVLQQRISAAGSEMRTYQKTAEELAEDERKLAEATEQLNRENQQVILNGQKVTASFNEMKASAGLLEQQLHELSADDPGRKKLLADYQALQERIDGVKKEMGETTDKGLTMKDALAFAGISVGLEAAVDVVKDMGAEIVQTVQEFEKLRSSINGLTGATGQELDQLTTGVAGLAKTFGKEYDEVLVASNALAKQMGISQQEAIRLIEQGFLSGADASGEFLDQVKEYAPQFKAAGLSASQFIGQVSQSVTTGVFSDKGADVVKEFGLRISEQAKSTSDAMEAAFGTNFTTKLFKGINDGSITSAQALQQVARQMDKTKIPANQLQTVIADVFGGPGEDAGLEYIKSLKNVAKGVDELVDKTNPYTQQQMALLNSNKALATAQNDLAKEFEGSGTVMQTLGNGAMTVLYTLLTSLAATWKEMVKPVQDVWASLMELGESMGWVSKEGTSAKTVGEAIGAVFRVILTPTKLLWEALAQGAKYLVEWAKGSEAARAALTVMAAPLRALYELLTNGPAYFAAFSAEAESRFGTIGRAWRKLMDRDFSGAASEFGNMGKNAGDAYTKAFKEATAKKPQVEVETTNTVKNKEESLTKASGGDGTTKADRDKAAAELKKEREKQRKEQAAEAKKALEEQAKIELGIQKTVEDAQISLLKDKHQREIAEINLQTDRKMAELKGSDEQIMIQWEALEAERQARMAEVRAKQAEEEEKLRLAKIDQERAQNEADQEVALADLELKLATGAMNQEAYDAAVLAVKNATAEKELALLKQRNGEESNEYKKAHAAKLAAEADLAAKQKKADDDNVKFKKAISSVQKVLASDEVEFIAAMLGKKHLLEKASIAARKALALVEIKIGLEKQYVSNAQTSKDITTFFGFLGPAAPAIGAAYLLASNAVSTAAAAVSAGKVMGFRSGGSTSAGAGSNVLDMAKLQVGANGKLLDEQGFAVAGLVHENEYVIPEWMRADPKVVQVEQWLEEKRLRGYVQGGATSDGGSLAAPVGDVAGSGEVATLLREILAVQQTQNERMDTWARELKVVNQLHDFDQEYDTYKKVNNQSGIQG